MPCEERPGGGVITSVSVAVTRRITEALQPVLGLKLRKSTSLISLISQTCGKRNQPEHEPETSGTNEHDQRLSFSAKRARSGDKSDTRSPSVEQERLSQDGDGSGKPSVRLKACNFPAMLLQIGNWQRSSQHVGDLVSKMYFAKRKIVWEVLEGGLKSKVEVQWGDISAIQARFYDDEPATLELLVKRPPQFFRETDPQPRKHTIWQATTDFTMGEATQCKPHRIAVAPGLMNRHWQKLLRCNPRLNALSQCPPPRALTILPPLVCHNDPSLLTKLVAKLADSETTLLESPHVVSRTSSSTWGACL